MPRKPPESKKTSKPQGTEPAPDAEAADVDVSEVEEISDVEKALPPCEKITVKLEVPIACPDDPRLQGYSTTSIVTDVRNRDKQLLKRLRIGLREQGARLENGKPVESVPQVIQWLFEAIAAEANAR